MEEHLLVDTQTTADRDELTQLIEQLAQFRLVRRREQAFNLFADRVQLTMHVEQRKLVEHASLELEIELEGVPHGGKRRAAPQTGQDHHDALALVDRDAAVVEHEVGHARVVDDEVKAVAAQRRELFQDFFDHLDDLGVRDHGRRVTVDNVKVGLECGLGLPAARVFAVDALKGEALELGKPLFAGDIASKGHGLVEWELVQ